MRHVTLAGTLAALTMLLLVAGSSPAHAFTPSYSMTIDDGAGPDELLTVPVADDCATNTAAFPGGIPCEMYETTSIPAGDPTARFDTSIPRPKFTIASGLPSLGGVPNGTQVGALGFTTGVDIPPCLPGFLILPYPGVSLVDAALPDYSLGPWAGSSNGMPLEGPDVAGTAALFSAVVWPVTLEDDPHANSYHASGAPLIARYFGIAPTGGPGTPINVLVFDIGTAYRTTTVIGDPALPPSATFCTPATTTVDFLGSTLVGTTPFVLRQCNVAGIDQVTATFIPSVGATVSVNDPVSCSPSAALDSSGNFCITGDSTGIGWDWRIYFETNAGPFQSYMGSVTPPPLSGSPPSALADAWVTSLAGHPSGGVTAVSFGNCFHINLDTALPTNATSPSAFVLYVSTGGPECLIVPPPGCSFNPVVYYVPLPVGGAVALAVSGVPSPLPVMPLAATVSALAATLAMAGWFARRWLR